jgi:hypothetical protein
MRGGNNLLEAYVRKQDVSRDQLRKFGPKTADHPSVGWDCPACHKPFAPGDYTMLVALGPGDDPEAQEKCRDGRFYNAVALEVHWACATGEVTTCPSSP